MADGSIVSVKELRKTYRAGLFRRRNVEALKGVSLDVSHGEIFGLLGPNGAGKTTLIKILLGIVRRSGGSANVLGLSTGDRRSRMRIGYLPESHRIPRHLTGNLALEYYGQLSHVPKSVIRKKKDALLETVGLEKWGTTSVTAYSKGMLQRLGLAQAMLHDPELLILDEPTDGVDPVGRAEIRDILFRLKDQGKTVFLNSHLLQELELVCDRVAILTTGNVRHVGPVKELTQASSSGVVFRLRSEDETVTPLIAELPFEVTVNAASGQPDGTTSVTVSSAGQEQIDQTIDVLRSAGVSIESVSHPRRTLEEVFLKLVDDHETDAE